MTPLEQARLYLLLIVIGTKANDRVYRNYTVIIITKSWRNLLFT